ncbi:MAG: hypothetical protein OXG13_13940 [Gemmatimonadaceae bacterium]|nr:hypothetical protein [Gemmatimonadaceae bacterium]
MMKPREVEIIMDLLWRLRPRRVLEWGSGYGTLYFTRRYSGFDTWLSIEHSEEWAERIRHLNTDPRVEIVSVETGEGFSGYVDYPSNRGAFDLVLVDGRARTACLARAPLYLSGRGCLILHDAGRGQYHPLPSSYEDNCSFGDYRDEGGLWIASQERAISDLIDLPRHLSVWKLYRRYGRQINWLYGPGVISRWREVL